MPQRQLLRMCAVHRGQAEPIDLNKDDGTQDCTSTRNERKLQQLMGAARKRSGRCFLIVL